MLTMNGNFQTTIEPPCSKPGAVRQDVTPRGRQIEAPEFERLLHRAIEVLSARERSALMERSRLTKAADAAVAIAGVS